MKKQIYRFLDDPEQLPKGTEEKELAELYHEVSHLASEDPGEDYWRHFNHRLQSRIDRRPEPRRLLRWWVLPSWIAAAAALLFAGLFFLPPKASPGLDDLDQDALLLAGELFEVAPEPESQLEELAEADFEVLLQAYEPIFEEDPGEEGFVPISPEKFKELWNLEG